MPINYTVYKNFFPSSDGKNKIAYYTCMPNHATPRSVVQIISDTNESFGAYSGLTEHLTSQGYVICVHDHIGRGESHIENSDEKRRTYIDVKKILVDDTLRMTAITRQNIENLPIVYMGFGEGAKIARKIMEESNSADGYVLADNFVKEKKTEEREYVKKDISLLILSKTETSKKANANWAQELYNKYISAKFTDVRMILYKTEEKENISKEMKEKIFSDLVNWLRERNF